MARPGGSGPPVSFKTVPGRHRTTKWNTARQYDYSGDDWGGYDAYDDYGDEDPPPPQQQQQYSAPPQPSYPTTLPSQQKSGRQMSFDGEERRQFSAGAGGSSLPYGNTGSSRGQSPAKSTTSSQGKRSGDYHRSQRDFTNPEQVPPPLNMSSARSSPAPGISPSAAPTGAYVPPRKTSLSSGSPVVEVPAAPAAKQEKELPTIPFIRPSDIYKRIEAERERERRESESSGRSGSMDSQTRAALDSPSVRALRPLSAVDEGEQESLSVVKGSFGEPANRDGTSPSALPNVRGVSGFGSDWFGGETSGSSDREAASMTSRDPAAEILAERTHDVHVDDVRASPVETSSLQATPTRSRGPAAEILAERTHDVHVDDVRASPVETSSLQATPTRSRDPAAEILAERTHDTHVDDIRASPAPTSSDTNLHHQPSQGYRSVVERAFDHSATSDVNSDISRDNSRSTNITNATSVSRSDSESTNQISPIMSRVPSGNTAQAQRQQAQQSEPTIAEEEPRGRSSVDGSATAAIAGAAAGVAGAAGVAAVAAGYRRNFTPPSSGTSPARKPGLQTTGERRISDGLVAETITSPTTAEEMEASGGPDQGTQLPPFQALDDNEAEAPLAAPQPTGPSALSQLSDAARTGRSRADTDYSMRESDLANAVNKTPSPTQPFSATFGNMTAAEAVQEEKAEQNLFLRNHAGGSTPKPQPQPFATSGSPGPGTPGTPGSGRASPSKGRVRDLADKFQEIHNSSRRGSQASVSTKSSWSKFDDREALSYPKRTQTQDTMGSNYDDEEGWRRSVVGMPGGDSGWTDSGGARPEMGGRGESFRPQLPGGWVSYRDGSPAVGTPVDEYSPVKGSDDDDEGDMTDIKSETTPRASKEVPSRGATEGIDLTPTTRKTQLRESDHFAQVSDAGSALGTSLLSKVGLDHKTRDVGSNEPAQPVEQPETQPKSRTGGLDALQAPHRPWLSRGDTGATDTTQGTEFSSAVSSVPPTPPAKDTPPASRDVETGGNYFSGAPLRTRASPKPGMQEDAPESFSNRTGSGVSHGSWVSHAMSLHPRSTDLESDRLRKEIARSLDPSVREQGTIEEDIDRTQDALDAPDNAARVDQGRNALPPAEQAQVKAPSPAAPRGFLDQRFSFEKSGEGMFGAGFASGSPLDAQKDLPPPPRVLEPTASQQSSPEIKPEMPYERPRSRGLHVMNADDELVDERGRLAEQPGNMYLGRNLSAATSSVGAPVSPISKSQENLHLGNVVEASRDDDDARGMLSPPSPMVDEGRDRGSGLGSLGVPSYYLSDGVPDLKSSSPNLSMLEEEDRGDASGTTAVHRDIPGPSIETSQPTLEDSTAPRPTTQDSNATLTSPTSPLTKQKIQPFREILAIKNPQERIQTYNTTRQTFAETNTGLNNWLNQMLIQHPEHANLSTPQAQSSASSAAERLVALKGTHGRNVSVANFKRQFSGGSALTSGGGASGAGEPTRVASSGDGGARNADVEKLKQGGKDLMKNASVLSKGLLAKGKGRFGSTRQSLGGSGGSKEPSRSTSPSIVTIRSINTTGPKVLDRSNPDSLVVTPTIERASSRASKASSIILPPSRSQNQTPLSTSSGKDGPLSRTFLRLREGSRSRSRSGSRPRSLVLSNAELANAREISPQATAGDQEAPGRITSPLISPWGEPGDAPTTPQRELGSDGVPERLGVLPSPTGGSFSVDSGMRLGSMNVSQSSNSVEEPESWTPQQTSRQLSLVEQGGIEPGEPAETSEEDDELYDITPAVTREAQDEHRDPNDLYDTTPKAAQRGFDLDPSTSIPEAKEDDQNELSIFDIARLADEEGTSAAEDSAEVSPQLRTTVLDVPQDTSREDRSVSPLTTRDGPSEQSDISAKPRDDGNIPTQTDTQDEVASKRSSISSLGDRHQAQPRDDLQDEPVIISQPVEPGPITSTTTDTDDNMATEPVSSQEAFMDRTYLSRPEVPRPLSYEPLDRDEGGEPAQETLNMGTVSQALRNEQDEKPDEPKSFEANFTSLSRHRKVSASSPVDRRSKRFSGMFGRQESQHESQEPQEAPFQPLTEHAPSASAISDEYGLGDLRDLHNDSPDATVDDEMSRQNSKQAKRKSGIWEAFRRPSGVSNSESSISRPSGVAAGSSNYEDARPMPPMVQSSYQGPQIEQMQRASTVTNNPEKKTKRSSMLGSIFGRSSTTGHKPEKPKKLSKGQSLNPSQLQQQTRPMPSGRLGNTDVYMVPQGPPPDTRWIDPRTQGHGAQPSLSSPTGPPPGGWYAPRNYYQPPGPPRQVPPQNFSRPPPPQPMHMQTPNENYGTYAYREPPAMYAPPNSMPFPNVPYGFRSVNDGYGRTIPPNYQRQDSYPPRMPPQVNAASGADTQGRPISYPQGQPPAEQQAISSPTRERQISNSTTEYSLSPQVSGQSEWLRSNRQQRGSTPLVSPLELKPSAEGLPPLRTERLGSIGETVARSPAREYPDQQTPYQIAMPAGVGSTKTSYYARQRRVRAAQPVGTMPVISTTPEQNSASGPVRVENTPRSPVAMTLVPPMSGSLSQTAVEQTASVDTKPESAPPPAVISADDTKQESNLQPSNKKLESSAEEQDNNAQSPTVETKSSADNPYLSVQLPNRGNRARHEDESDSEESMQMRGSSYPGQEWIPYYDSE